MTSATIPRIPETLHMICEYSDKRTLAYLSRTCKYFENPALDVLWKHTKGFYKLVRCLPDDAWMEEMRRENILCMVLRRPLEATDCERFLQYCSRVQTLTVGNSSPVVDESILQALRQLTLNSETIFPKLQTLILHYNDGYMNYFSSSFAHMFVGSQLNRVKIIVCGKLSPAEDSEPEWVIQVLREKVPSFKHLQISMCDESAPIEEKRRWMKLPSDSLISSWKHLYALEVPHLSYPSLLEVAKLPQLKKLSLWNCHYDLPASDILVHVNGGFPALKDVFIISADAASCITVLEMMDQSPVAKFCLRIMAFEEAETWNTICSIVSQHLNPDEFLSLDFGDGESGPGGAPEFFESTTKPIYFENIKPLRAFKYLTNLQVSPARGMHFHNPNVIMEMATTWRYIEQLIFEPKYPWRAEPSKITLLDLIPFTAYCPRIWNLGLTIDATNPPPIGYLIKNRRPLASLTRFCVFDSPIKNPSAVAVFLSSIFPSLVNLEGSYLQPYNSVLQYVDDRRTTRDHEDMWREVGEVAKILCTVRAEEQIYKVDYSGQGGHGRISKCVRPILL